MESHKKVNVLESIKEKITKENNLIKGFQTLKLNTKNKEVKQKCNNQIREAQLNIDYYSELMDRLVVDNTNEFNFEDSSVTHNVSKSKKTNKKFLFSSFDLIKYNCVSLGHKIHYMLHQLQFKLHVENLYLKANDKISKLYLMDGDTSTSTVAEWGKVESDLRIQLLNKAYKKYQNMNINFDVLDQDMDFSNFGVHGKKSISGKLFIGVVCTRDINHVSSPIFTKNVESVVVIKVDDIVRVRTKPVRTEKWNENFEICIDKEKEVEILIYDIISSSFIPVAVNWFLIADVLEDIRRKKVKNDNYNYERTSSNNSLDQKNDTNLSSNNMNLVTNVNTNIKLTNLLFVTLNSNHTYKTNEAIDKNQQSQTDLVDSFSNKVSINTWITLEPMGEMLLNIGFEKTNINEKFSRKKLGRHGAIRQKKDEIFRQQGHFFVQKSFYNIMCCAVCNEFLRYSGYQCKNCRFLCHKKCYQNVISKCFLVVNNDLDKLLFNHHIPHKFEQYNNYGSKWCSHCGFILPWSRKNVYKCTECSLMVHYYCIQCIPDFCGMSMETANKIIETIEFANAKKKLTSLIKTVSHENLISVVNLNDLSSKKKTRRFSHDFKKSLDFNSHEKSNHLNDTNDSISFLGLYFDFDDPGKNYNTKLNLKENLESNKKQSQNLINHNDNDKHIINHVFNSNHEDKQKNNSFTNFEIYNSNITTHVSNFKPKVNVDLSTEKQSFNSHKLIEKKSIPCPKNDHSHESQVCSINGKTKSDNENHGLEKETENKKNNKLVVNEKLIDMLNDLTNFKSSFQNSETTLKVSEPSINRNETNNYINKSLNNASSLFYESKKRAFQNYYRKKITLDDFQFIAVLGKGNFGKVMLAESRHTQKLYAIKVLKKDFIIENEEADSVMSEKRIFLTANMHKHPFLLNLNCCFQTANRVYFVMEYISGGDLMYHIQRSRFSPQKAKFYACEVLLALKYFHENNIVYRDLKLDNILLTKKGHIKIADYGLCKENMDFDSKTSTFCGTPEFMAPEVVLGKQYDKNVDWWAFGVLLFQMLFCQSPFRGDDEEEIFNAIEHDDVKYPMNIPSTTIMILQELLNKDPKTRLGSGRKDALEVMKHPYFDDVNFDDVLNCRIPPPFIPEISNKIDYGNFDLEFTSETPKLTPINTLIDDKMQEKFKGFSHIADNFF